MDADLEPVYLAVTQAEHPEDVFGFEDIILPVNTLLDYLEQEFKKRAEILNPENYSNIDDIEAAKEALPLLKKFYEEGQARIEKMLYGMLGFGLASPISKAKSFKVGNRTYYIGPKLAVGESFTHYEGFVAYKDKPLGEVLLKLANTPEDNLRLEQEVRVLNHLHSVDVPQWRHFPYILDRFNVGGRKGLAIRKVKAFRLSDVRSHPRHQAGIDQKHMVWILDRLLSALGFCHEMGVVYGGLTPEHVFLQTELHGAFIAGGWGSAAIRPAVSNEKVIDIHEIYSPPEVKAKGKIGPWSDIYSLGKLIIWILGGNPAANEIPEEVEPALRDFILDMVVESSDLRPNNAWELYQVQCEIKKSIWAPKFLHFDMS